MRDAELTSLFRSLEEGVELAAPEPGFADDLFESLRAQAHRNRFGGAALLAAAALLFAGLIGGALVSGSGVLPIPAPSESPTPSAALPSPSIEASASELRSPSPSASEPPSPSPGLSSFTSTIHGISIDYPAGWQTRRATEPWPGGELNFDSPAADVIFDPTLGDRLYIALASRPSGRTQADQIELLNGTNVCNEGVGGGGGSFVLDGAGAFDWYCGDYKVAATTFDLRGYLILMLVPGELYETYDFDWIEAVLLETVDLRPEDAVD